MLLANQPLREMTSRERFLRLVSNEPTDRGLFFSEHFWGETTARWQEEGMPCDYDFEFDFDFHVGSLGALGVNIGYFPPFEQEVVADEDSTQLIRDEYGIIKRVSKGHSGMPQFVEFPVHDRSSWEKIKSRLDPNPDISARFPQDWAQRVETLKQAHYPIIFTGGHLTGFFSFLRELTGDRVYYLFHDDPDLVREMLDFQVYRLTTFIKRITKEIQLDGQFIWEDMCCKTGPLIGPPMFREFILEPYQRTIEASKSCGMRAFYVDSDGNLDALIPLWLEAGVNMMEPFEVAAGMDVVKVKETYGDKLVVVGGIDKRALAADFDAIDQEIERIRPAYEMGGYIPCLDHSAPPNISWENYLYYLEKRKRLVGKE